MADAPILGGDQRLTLDDDVFGAKFNGPLVHECVVAELAARRQGTHSTLTRGMVRGGGAKPWRQKGTGRARQGTIRAPQWTGGGVVFGPSPRHYTVKVNRKARRAALRAALSLHAERGSIFGLDPDGFDAPSTKQAAGLLEDRRGGSVLLLLSAEEAGVAKSFRNLARVHVLPAEAAGVADIVSAASAVLVEGASPSISASTTWMRPSRARSERTPRRAAAFIFLGVRWEKSRGCGPWTTPPPANCGARVEPWRARPVPFCLWGLRPPPRTSPRVLVEAVP